MDRVKVQNSDHIISFFFLFSSLVLVLLPELSSRGGSPSLVWVSLRVSLSSLVESSLLFMVRWLSHDLDVSANVGKSD